jgi:hypothetical protein
MVSGSISLPSPGFFSPFPHGTTSLSVAVTYLALESGLPRFRQGFSCPAVLRFCSHVAGCISHTGLSPSSVALPSSVPLYIRFLTTRGRVRLPQNSPSTPRTQRRTAYTHVVWALPLSLAATQGITVVVFSSGYLDGSVPRVSLCIAMYSLCNDRTLLRPGYPIR